MLRRDNSCQRGARALRRVFEERKSGSVPDQARVWEVRIVVDECTRYSRTYGSNPAFPQLIRAPSALCRKSSRATRSWNTGGTAGCLGSGAAGCAKQLRRAASTKSVHVAPPPPRCRPLSPFLRVFRRRTSQTRRSAGGCCAGATRGARYRRTPSAANTRGHSRAGAMGLTAAAPAGMMLRGRRGRSDRGGEGGGGCRTLATREGVSGEVAGGRRRKDDVLCVLNKDCALETAQLTPCVPALLAITHRALDAVRPSRLKLRVVDGCLWPGTVGVEVRIKLCR